MAVKIALNKEPILPFKRNEENTQRRIAAGNGITGALAELITSKSCTFGRKQCNAVPTLAAKCECYRKRMKET